MTGLEGRTALVTGAGRGIGRAIALALGNAGAKVVAAARTAAEVEAVAEEIRGAGATAASYICDVSDTGSITALGAAVGPVDILVNNAGIAPGGPLTTLEDELWERTLLINLTGPFRLTRMLLPAMLERRWGRVINIASILSRTAFPQTAAYTASKHGLLGLTRAVAAEVAASGVTVNAICPGYANTPMTAGNIQAVASRAGKAPEEVRSAFARTSPQRRLIEPDEVAFLVTMLCTEEARGINGQALQVDGGALLC